MISEQQQQQQPSLRLKTLIYELITNHQSDHFTEHPYCILLDYIWVNMSNFSILQREAKFGFGLKHQIH